MASKQKKSGSVTPSLFSLLPGRSASTPISQQRPGSPLSPTRQSRLQEKCDLQNLNYRLACYIDRVRNLKTENSKLLVEIQTTRETVTRETSNIKSMYDHELSDLQNLNDRLACYIDRVRNLEIENSKLLVEIQTTWETVTRETSNIKSMYDQELSDARKLLDETAREKAKLEIDTKRLLEENDDLRKRVDKKTKDLLIAENSARMYESRCAELNGKYSTACSERKKALDDAKELEKDNILLRKHLEEETLARVDLENNVQSLREELTFKDQVYQQELTETRSRRQVDISEIDGRLAEQYEDKLQSLQELRDQYESQMRQNREEIEAIYENKVRSLQSAAQRHSNASSATMEELRQTRSRIDGMSNKINELEGVIGSQTARIRDLEKLLEVERIRHHDEVQLLESELQRMRDEMAQQLQEYQDLMDIKVSLDLEIAAYDKMLKGEEFRLNLTPTNNASVSQQSTNLRSRLNVPFSRTPSRAQSLKRKRTVLEESEDRNLSDFQITSSSKSDIEILEADPEGKFVKLHNKANRATSTPLSKVILKQPTIKTAINENKKPADIQMEVSHEFYDNALKKKKELELKNSKHLAEQMGSKLPDNGRRMSGRINNLHAAAAAVEIPDNEFYTTIKCSTIRIGSFKYTPIEKVLFSSKGIRIKAPNVKDQTENVILDIQICEVIKIVADYSRALSILFLYVSPSCSHYICESLEMANDNAPYFNPVQKSEYFKRIIFQIKNISKVSKLVFRLIYSSSILEEIISRDAHDLLNRSMTKESNIAASTSNLSENIRKILIYPQGKGGISINTEDYICLGTDQYLNDIIIDFFLNYLRLEVITDVQRNKTHIFSSFFYKRLTTTSTRQRQSEKDAKLSASQKSKRHARVKSWTKNVNIFEKDFIIIPINEQSHWFLAIICYPGLEGTYTLEGNIPVKETPLPKKKSDKKQLSLQIGSTTITPVSKREVDSIYLGDDSLSERDEAEGDDSEMASDESDAETDINLQPIKQPCILIFDSLAGASRSRVVETLRDYLTCEYKAKVYEKSTYVFNKLTIPGNSVKVPQQNNFTDCGLYLLQYVEHFFKDPIADYRLPIKQLTNWFDAIVVTRKREEISNLLKELVEKYNPDSLPLPEINFPTLNGKLLEEESFNEEQVEFEEEEMGEMEEEIEEAEEDDETSNTTEIDSSPEKKQNDDRKCSLNIKDSTKKKLLKLSDL